MNLKVYLAVIGLISTSVYAVEPVSGTYGGVVLGGSYMFPIPVPATREALTNAPRTAATISSALNTYLGKSLNGVNYKNAHYQLNYGFMGLLGVQVGYRLDELRVEGQIFYNSSPVSSLSIWDANSSVKLSNNKNDANVLYPSGQTNLIAGMANFYYDFIPPSTLDTNFAPFVGFGVGYANVQNNFNLNFTTAAATAASTTTSTTAASTKPISTEINQNSIVGSSSTAAGQLIVGMLYFLDDFSYFGLDGRIFSTLNINAPPPYNTINYNYQFISGNLTFNGHFDLG